MFSWGLGVSRHNTAASLLPSENLENFQARPFLLLHWGMNTDFKPLENEPVLIEKAENALRQGKLEECRRLAAPIFHHYCVHNRPLSPAMERLFGVYVAISQGYVEAREILCDAESST
jgi:hypothetical protein